MSGAVIGDTIVYDKDKLIIEFTVANIPEDTTDLARILHEAVTNPNAKRVKIHVENQVMPDLLKHEAQAILSGKLGADGVFYASELLLKCPSRARGSCPQPGTRRVSVHPKKEGFPLCLQKLDWWQRFSPFSHRFMRLALRCMASASPAVEPSSLVDEMPYC